MEELIQINAYPVKNVLPKLLQDKTTGKNIIFATDNYSSYECDDTDQITVNALLGFDSLDIQPRVMKAQAEQSERTRKKAEVFTPTWIVKKMCDHCDSVWAEGKSAADWQKYIDLRILEITCGEAPFLVTRYDTTTGEPLPIAERVGMLDRKLQRISKHAADEAEWLKWATRAYESTYGYEFQGDNLLIARINLLVTFCDYLEDRWKRSATDSELGKLANVIAWNLWQMDGLKDTVPVGVPKERDIQLSLFDDDDDPKISVTCTIYNWSAQKQRRIPFSELKGERTRMKFDFVIGNPPYQEDRRGESTTALPVYHHFMNAAYAVGRIVELITPARFLFNAGRTPKDWNSKMLSDKHLKVLLYEGNASTIFPNTEIKGGVAITYRDTTRDGSPIGTFSIYPEVNTILAKISSKVVKNGYMDSIGFVASKFNTSALFLQYPQYIGHERRMSSNVLSFDCFHDSASENEDVYVYGIICGKRAGKYISRTLVDTTDVHIDKYKIIMPKADGSGHYGDSLTMPEILKPNSGFTHTFLGMGAFSTESETKSALKYIKSKFARSLLSVLKVTQDMNADKWRLVPLQDFTSESDIDWSVSIPEIDRQLYKKYGLTQEEIDFIETHVKEME